VKNEYVKKELKIQSVQIKTEKNSQKWTKKSKE